MVKALSFKGDPKPKKRKRTHTDRGDAAAADSLAVARSGAREGKGTEEEQEDTSWVTADDADELQGPVLLVFQTSSSSAGPGRQGTRAYCLAVDANGSVYASPLQGGHDDDNDAYDKEEDDAGANASPSTAEPSSVQQVWVAVRVAGQRELSFRAWTGRYLGADATRKTLRATREARGTEEGFLVERAHSSPTPASGGDELQTAAPAGRHLQQEEELLRITTDDGEAVTVAGTYDDTAAGPPVFHLRSSTGSLVTISGSSSSSGGKPPTFSVDNRADDEEPGIENARVTVRMQARFKPTLAAAKRVKAYEKVSRATLEKEAGRSLKDDEVVRLRRARKDGGYREAMLDIRAKGAHDKFA